MLDCVKLGHDGSFPLKYLTDVSLLCVHKHLNLLRKSSWQWLCSHCGKTQTSYRTGFLLLYYHYDNINRLHNMMASLISEQTSFVCNWERLISWYDTCFCLWDKTNLNQFERSRKNCACMSVTLWLHTLHVCESAMVHVTDRECEDARTSLHASLFFVTGLVSREFVFQCLNLACTQAKDRWLSNMSTAVLLNSSI